MARKGSKEVQAVSAAVDYVPPDYLAMQKLEAELDIHAFCLDWECGHKRAHHKGLQGYCHMTGCPCRVYINSDQAAEYHKRNEWAPPPDTMVREVVYGPDPNFRDYVRQAEERRGGRKA